MNKRTIAIGLTLFALFFGAGNLIFPPSLGWRSGDMFNWAILGFIITGVGLPLIGVIAGSFSEEGFNKEARRVHPAFAILFMVTIYLTIGPFFAIPRTAATSFELGIEPFLSTAPTFALPFVGEVKIFLLLFTVVYFAAVFALSVKPNKLVDNIGKILTPMLLLTIIALVIRALFVLTMPVTMTAEGFNAETPFFNGFLDGYETMDTIAAVAFSIIVLKAVKATGLSAQKDIFKEALKAALIAGFCLALIYLSLGWVGNNYTIEPAEYARILKEKQHLGSYILTKVAFVTYGLSGKFLLSVMVGLACLTTAVGLVVAVSSYFHELWPRISYKTYAILFTLISFVLANQGLSQVIKGSLPVLFIIYPITMVLIALVFADKIFKGLPNLSFQLAIGVTVIVSILSQLYPSAVSSLPFSDISMHWVLPALDGALIGVVLNAIFRRGRPI